MSGIDYKIRARSKWPWRGFDTVRLPVSVGQDYHEGAKLAATTDWARQHFKNKIIILGDAPQRYNLMFKHGYSEEMAMAAALKAGNEWLARNRPYLHGLTITRWDDWKTHPEYQAAQSRINMLYTINADVHAALHTASTALWERRYAAAGGKEQFFALSEKYLLEETAVFATAYNAIEGISAYPGDFLKIWEIFVDKKGADIPAGLNKAHCVRISFEKLKSPQAYALQGNVVHKFDLCTA